MQVPVLKTGQHWEGWFRWQAQTWEDCWRLVVELHRSRLSVQFGERPPDSKIPQQPMTFVPFLATGVRDGLWLYRYSTIDGEPALKVFGDALEVDYSDRFLRSVQVEYPEIELEDPPPARFWFPRQLMLSLEQAEPMVKALVRCDDIPATTLLMAPKVVLQ